MGLLTNLKFFTVLTVVLMFCTLSNSHVSAQTKSKPKLVPIILNKDTSDPKAEIIVDTLIKQHIQKNNLEKIYEYGDIYAKFIPLEKKGSSSFFIVSQIMEPPLGCYAMGCDTRIYYSENGKTWKGVFGLHAREIWYDLNSKTKSPANIIATSFIDRSNIAVWIWNNNTYLPVGKTK